MVDDARIEVPTRRHQMFPALTDAEVARIRRFGSIQRYPRGTQLFAAGAPGPGMFVVLKGTVSITQRDGLGRVVPIAQQGRGQFLAEVAQLSGGYALADGRADDDVETLLVPPDQLRALLIGGSESRDLLRVQNFLRRNGHPHQVIDATQADATKALLTQYGATVTD